MDDGKIIVNEDDSLRKKVERQKQLRREWERRNVERRNKTKVDWIIRNPEKYKQSKRDWNNKHKDKIREASIKYYHNHSSRFGGNRSKVLERDNWECQLCGMNNEQHIVIFGRGISVDHIDGQGRNSKTPNNNLENLRTLCLRCHGRIDERRKGRYG